MGLLSFLLRDTQKKTVVAPPARDILRDLFRNAVFGHTFRTRAYQNINDNAGQSEWMDAVYRPDLDRWSVRRLTETPVPGLPIPYVKIETQTDVPDNIDLISIVEKFITYETTQADLGHMPVAGSDPEQLGASYFRTFAENEALAFDIDGKVYPVSAHGDIMSDAVFMADTIIKAREAMKARNEELAKRAASSESGPVIVAPTDTAQEEIYGPLPSVNEIFATLYHYRDLCQLGHSRGFEKLTPDKNGSVGKNMALAAKKGNEVLSKCLEDLFPDDYPRAQDCRKLFSSVYNTAILYGGIGNIQDCQKYFGRDFYDNVKYSQDRMDQIRTSLADALISMGRIEDPSSALLDRIVSTAPRQEKYPVQIDLAVRVLEHIRDCVLRTPDPEAIKQMIDSYAKTWTLPVIAAPKNALPAPV